MSARRWDEVRERRILLCALAVKVTDSSDDANSPGKVAAALKRLEERRFVGLAALVGDPDQRQDLERWIKKSSKETIRRAVQRAFDGDGTLASVPRLRATPRSITPMPTLERVAERSVLSRAVGAETRERSGGRGAYRSPLWFVGRRQRDDLEANYHPVPPDHTGSLLPFLLNRGKTRVTDVQVRIGTEFRSTIPLIEPGERGDLQAGLGPQDVRIVTDLVGGIEESMRSHSEGASLNDYRHLVEVRFLLNGRVPRALRGELRGSVKRGFYLFTPETGPPTPIY